MRFGPLVRLGLGAGLLGALGLGAYVVATAPPAVGDWRVEEQAPVACFEAVSAVVEGRLYRFGGFGRELRASVASWRLDPEAGGWEPVADLPTPVTHVNAAVDGRALWIAGGFVGDDPGAATDAVWRFDTGGNVWEPGPPLPVVRSGGALVLLGRRLHYFGGFGADRDTVHGDHFALELDDLREVDGAWTPGEGSGWTRLAPLPVPRGHVGGAVVDGRIFAIGGQLRHDTDPLDLRAVHAYSPEEDRWAACAPLPTARSHCEQSVFCAGGRIHVLGGRDTARLRNRFLRRRNPYAPLDAVTVYRAGADRWSAAARLPVGLLGPSAHVVGDRVLLVGGSVEGPWEPRAEVYSIALDALR